MLADSNVWSKIDPKVLVFIAFYENDVSCGPCGGPSLEAKMGTPKKWNSQNRRQENDIFGFDSDVFVMSDHHKHDTEKPIKTNEI